MSSPETTWSETELAECATRLSEAVRAAIAGGDAERVPDQTVQDLMTLAVKLYVARREAGSDLLPFDDDAVTATEVMVTATSMLKAVQLEVFELTLWNGFGTI
ncbi:MAG TPA: hypothetical protein VEQ11_00665 [Chloroflexota bacterium]|nr:hypothetical protein [Chloroflexota bacterium]